MIDDVGDWTLHVTAVAPIPKKELMAGLQKIVRPDEFPEGSDALHTHATVVTAALRDKLAVTDCEQPIMGAFEDPINVI